MTREPLASRGTKIPIPEAVNKGPITTSLRSSQGYPLERAAPQLLLPLPTRFLLILKPGFYKSAKQGLEQIGLTYANCYSDQHT